MTKITTPLLYIQFFFIVIIELEYYYSVSLGNYNHFGVEVLQYQLLFLYVWTIVTAKLFFPWKHIYFLFLLTIGVFQFNRIFLDIFGLFNFEYTTKYVYMHMPAWASIELILLFLLILSLVHFGLLLGETFFGSNMEKNSDKISFSSAYYSIGKILFIIFFPLFMHKLLIQVNYVLQHGYLSMFTDLKNYNYPFWTKGSGTILVMAYSFIIASRPNKKQFIFYSSLFLLTQVAVLIQGVRQGFIVAFLFIIWYYYKAFVPKNRDINIKKIFLVGIAFILLSQTVVIIRSGGEFKLEDINKLFLYFFSQQGTSFHVPYYMIYFKDEFVRDGLPYILTPIASIGTLSHPQTMETLENYRSLSYHLTYFLSPEIYLSGAGIGGSFIGEFYDLPLPLMILLSIFLGMFIFYFDKKVLSSRLWLFFTYLIASKIIYMPRDKFFLNINVVVFMLFIYYSIDLIKKEKNA